ncbi:hypothetical protein ACT17_14740 [Mycolicibacterium conceptionense]|uniref:Uncharacterized protein n=1 Tax=Mycolicibacterium conceptionense TaxID=451644 RepID=A0A0J8U811_9MYCO|nr:hypothetical protein [Mycolicibacterium conceptionense]KMV17551.1 hypothetical protein ACT17_14740 [Mycolicibacterium conceptionense]
MSLTITTTVTRGDAVLETRTVTYTDVTTPEAAYQRMKEQHDDTRDSYSPGNAWGLHVVSEIIAFDEWPDSVATRRVWDNP